MIFKGLSSQLLELRVHLSPNSTGSKGLREFVKSNYKKIKDDNPKLPFLVREAENSPARIFARYAKGFEKRLNLENLSEKQIEAQLKTLEVLTAPSSKPQF
ncbi:hypothetical protein HK099_006254 [Clydaea vesicula]|uniref:Ribosomal protein/NADH dehydrogenase domain-containing protein n=1 Tax=Clydaea vesicula TaxID=447962 RepID=A0AAD5TZ64_9FUNG|nr:hypothetical protein HK099_006254 [Clydaea vesicula]KAJ3387913.1 hypothetical protein HDU92_001742 [Lobulomyces angularis]